MVLAAVGFIIILLGLLLSLTIILLPLGFILMIVGSVLMMIGMFGRRKTVITNVVQVSNTPGGMQANIPLDHDLVRAPVARSIEPAMGRARPREPRLIDVTPSSAPSVTPKYDVVKWRALVEYDEDIARIAEALARYPEKYTDEFAAAYMALNDKTYLPIIIKKVLASAKADADMGSQRYS